MKEQLAPVGGFARVEHLYQSQPNGPIGFAQRADVVGDLNGDGVDDFGIADHQGDNSPVSFYSGVDGNLLFSLDGGSYFAGVGDMDGDGVADIATSGLFVNGVPESRVYSGATQTVIWAVPRYGYSAPAGDVNGDGVVDWLIQCDVSHSVSETWVYSGVDGSLIRSLAGGEEWTIAHGGSETAALGDLDGDGFGELLIGDRAATSSTGMSRAGQAYVYSGFDGRVLFSYEGEFYSGELGLAVSALPDWNGDQITDFLIGGRWLDEQGEEREMVRAYSGADGTKLFELKGRWGDRFGGAIATVPDLDGDGVAEILVGAPWRSDHPWWWPPFYGGHQGSSMLYSGASLDLLLHLESYSRKPYSLDGTTVRGMTDLNGDGRGEFLVLGYGFDPTASYRRSSVRIMSFNPQLFLSERTISAAVGGTIGFELDYSDDPSASLQPYKVLMSGLRGSQTDHLGVGVPLGRDSLFERTYQGVYPFPRSGPMHGVLDANGKRSFQLNFAPGQLSNTVGRTYSFAAVIEPVAGQAIASSSAVTLEVLP